MVSIQKETIKRLVKDITQIVKQPLTENGIYYEHDSEDMLKGYVMIVGPEDTPYFGGFYFFTINFSSDYPHTPPIVKYHTNINNIRFNPNLYVNEKVCVSILNTHPSGDKWSSCQNINSILLSLLTIFTKIPLLNEPGITINNHRCNIYTEIILFSNINHAICDIIDKKLHLPFFDKFENVMEQHFLKNYETIKNIIIKNKEIINNNNNKRIFFDFYRFSIQIDYINLLEKYEKCFKNKNKSNEGEKTCSSFEKEEVK